MRAFLVVVLGHVAVLGSIYLYGAVFRTGFTRTGLATLAVSSLVAWTIALRSLAPTAPRP